MLAVLDDLFSDSWLATAWGMFGDAAPMLCAIVVIAFAARIAWACGVISFAPVAIAAIGGYLAANLLVAGLGLALALLCAAVSGAWLGLVLAMLLARLPAHAQSFATLAMVFMIGPVARAVPGWTGGNDGISIAGIVPLTGMVPILVNAALLAVVVVGCSAVDGTWFAIAARAVRHDRALAAGMGIQRGIVHAIGFGLAGLFAALGGAMLVLAAGVASPAVFPLSLSLLALAAPLLGGTYLWSGPIIGSLIFALPSALLGAATSELLDIANAMAVIVLLIFLPRGLLDPRDSLRREARERRRQSRVAGIPPPPADDDRRHGSRHGLQSGHASRLTAAIKRRTGGTR